MNRRSFLKFIGTATAVALTPKKVITEPRKINEEIVQPDFIPSFQASAPSQDIEVQKTDVESPIPTPTASQELPKFEFDKHPENLKVKSPEFNQNYQKPFSHIETNQVSQKLGITLSDLYNPNQERIKNFSELENNFEILPIFEPGVEQWADLVQELCFEHNEENPNNKISPNIMLSLMSIESQGIPNAVSHANALGLMQITSAVYAGGFFGNYTSKQMLDPKTNIRVSILYLSDILKKAKRLGLTGTDIWQYVSMEYNGGSRNASRYFKTPPALDVFGPDDEIFQVNSFQKVLNYLQKFKGNTSGAIEYGTNMVKRESLHYREKFARYQVIAEIASNLKKEGYSNDDIKEMLSVSDIVKNVAAGIYRSKENLRNQKGFTTYFDIREIVESFSNPEYDFSSLPKIDKPESKNSANLFLSGAINY